MALTSLKARFLILLATSFLFNSCNHETKTSKKEEVLGYCGNINDLTEPKEVQENCMSCHAIYNKVVGASFEKISKRNLSKKEFISLMEDPKEFNSKSEIPHPVFSNLSDNEISNIYNWIDSLKYN